MLNRVRFKKEQARRKEAEKRKGDKPNVLVTIEEQEYLNALDRMILICPKEPPKTWHDTPLAEAKDIAKRHSVTEKTIYTKKNTFLELFACVANSTKEELSEAKYGFLCNYKDFTENDIKLYNIWNTSKGDSE